MIIKTTVTKTVQEDSFEPILISCTIEKEIPDSDYTKEMKQLRNITQKEVKEAMEGWLED